MDELATSGVTVVKLLDEGARAATQASLLRRLHASPELVAPSLAPEPGALPPLVQLGGAGFLGTASSFHFEEVRRLRGAALRAVGPLIAPSSSSPSSPLELQGGASDVAGTVPKNVQVLVDRLCVRLPGQAPEAESFHRDLSPPELCAPGDEIYGGWVNLSPSDQHFSCVKRTHRDTASKPDAQGFTLITKKNTAQYKAKATLIRIPPGHMVIFHQVRIGGCSRARDS